jgi:hypothetical protein
MAKKIWGPTATGAEGDMTEADFLAFAIAKVGDGGVGWRKNASKAFNAISNHEGEAGANDKFPYKGKSICHVSEGARNKTDGCSVFFTAKGGEIARIVGIGHHIGSASYELEWQEPNWDTTGKNITL